MKRKLSLQEKLDKKMKKRLKKISSNMRLGMDDETAKRFKEKIEKKSRGGMINGNDLVASYYEKG
tara:strand:- start:441 stop:635 length:195 start_codon:yes stop_codon:yes gene_type:complete